MEGPVNVFPDTMSRSDPRPMAERRRLHLFLAVMLFATGDQLVDRWIAPILLIAVAFIISPLRPSGANPIGQAEAAQLMATPSTGDDPNVIIYHRPAARTALGFGWR